MNVSDDGGLNLLRLTSNWTNNDRLITDISQSLLEYAFILTGIPDNAESLQISIENRLGSSLLSEPVKIVCDHSGCKPSISFVTGVTITGIVCLIGGILIGGVVVFLIRRGKQKKSEDPDFELKDRNINEDPKYEIAHANNNSSNNNEDNYFKIEKNNEPAYIQIEPNKF